MTNPTRFPQMHIAASVINRIMNVADELKNKERPASVVPAPSPKPVDPTLEGQLLNEELLRPSPPVDAPSEIAQAIALNPLIGP